MQEITLAEDNQWKSCCLTVDRAMCMYAVQFSLALCVLSFSGVMLALSAGNCEKSSPYFSLISFVIGSFLPRTGVGQNDQLQRRWKSWRSTFFLQSIKNASINRFWKYFSSSERGPSLSKTYVRFKGLLIVVKRCASIIRSNKTSGSIIFFL